jgi:hypothetical protein
VPYCAQQSAAHCPRLLSLSLGSAAAVREKMICGSVSWEARHRALQSQGGRSFVVVVRDLFRPGGYERVVAPQTPTPNVELHRSSTFHRVPLGAPTSGSASLAKEPWLHVGANTFDTTVADTTSPPPHRAHLHEIPPSTPFEILLPISLWVSFFRSAHTWSHGGHAGIV